MEQGKKGKIHGSGKVGEMGAYLPTPDDDARKRMFREMANMELQKKHERLVDVAAVIASGFVSRENVTVAWDDRDLSDNLVAKAVGVALALEKEVEKRLMARSYEDVPTES